MTLVLISLIISSWSLTFKWNDLIFADLSLRIASLNFVIFSSSLDSFVWPTSWVNLCLCTIFYWNAVGRVVTLCVRQCLSLLDPMDELLWETILFCNILVIKNIVFRQLTNLPTKTIGEWFKEIWFLFFWYSIFPIVIR